MARKTQVTENSERPAIGLELDLPREVSQTEEREQYRRGVMVLDISPALPNEIKL